MGLIYKIENKINGKVYIGFTTQPIKKRWAEHVSTSKKYNHHFANAIKKHGKNNFEVSEIEKCASIEVLKNRETYWIEFYDSYNPKVGYNSTKGGDGNIPNEETKAKMSKARIGKKHSQETCSKISAANKGENHYIYGKHRSLETCKKISKSKKGINAGKNHYMYGVQQSKDFILKRMQKIRKPILQFDKQGNFIKEWISGTQVKRELKINNNNISQVCKHKKKSAGGFIWEYKNLI